MESTKRLDYVHATHYNNRAQWEGGGENTYTIGLFSIIIPGDHVDGYHVLLLKELSHQTNWRVVLKTEQRLCDSDVVETHALCDSQMTQLRTYCYLSLVCTYSVQVPMQYVCVHLAHSHAAGV